LKYLQNPWVKYPLLLIVAGLFVWQLVGKTTSGSGGAPDFSLVNQSGEKIQLSDYRGDVVILDFWATWCPPCKAEIPDFVDLHEKYKDEGLTIIGVSLDQTGWSDVRPFLKNYNVEYPVVLGTRELVEKYGNIRSIPTTFVIDPDGKIQKKYVGYKPGSVFEDDYMAMREGS